MLFDKKTDPDVKLFNVFYDNMKKSKTRFYFFFILG